MVAVSVRVELQVGSRRRRRRTLRTIGLSSARRPTGVAAAWRPRATASAHAPAGRSLLSLRWVFWAALGVLLVCLAYVAFALVRAVPGPTVSVATRSGSFAGHPPALAWPHQGEAAIALQGVGLIGVHGSGKPTPIASIAKVMTAYVVLRDHPLSGTAAGPRITVTPADVATYRADDGAGQSVVAVRVGEHLSERQALEGLLLPSGNNLASLLARWDARRQARFVARMNAQARALGLAHTHYADASGVQAATVSTAADQVALAMRAMALPAFGQTVAMAQATLPIAGPQDNLDRLLGKDGIVGIKTGSTSEAGGCFVFAARERLPGRSVTVVGAVLHQHAGPAGSSPIAPAFNATTTLLGSTRGALAQRRVIKRGDTLGWVKAPWSDRVALVAASSASFIGWPGLAIHARIATALALSPPVSPGQNTGTVVLASGQQRATVALVASRAVPGASLGWRLAHP